MGEAKSKKSGPIPTSGLDRKQGEIKAKSNEAQTKSLNITYGKVQFRYVFIGLALITLGLILVSGGSMPSPDVWDESIIYSPRRLVLAPICILAGLVLQIFAIFKTK